MENITISKELLETINIKLNSIKLQVDSMEIKKDLNHLIELIEPLLVDSNGSIEEKVYEKMIASRHVNDELYFKLYMLHRKIVDKKVSNDEAIKLFNLYIH